ncbi:guanine nucleotide exchange factor [Desarmillaria tabescens]|uniref:Pleckstrin homology domain-containing protein n=1 Tax=Armillaria tabescens TaxID=1929756 RepID=A0AA39NFT0_ARMTA|nr:guanine nucleotide exchange factor [Desarmillaria tabescens]KAK0464663.1 Pleckstrin homology domain-containing protein [Desarmillaria tabescens]
MLRRTISQSTVGSSASQAIQTSEDVHVHRRVFIGPMPEKLLSGEATTDQDEERNLSQLVKNTAYRFFLLGGGNPDEWGESNESSVREEMLSKWRESEWGAIWNRKLAASSTVPDQKWVGSSFEVGSFLGVNVLESMEAVASARSSRKGMSDVHLPLILEDEAEQLPSSALPVGDSTASANETFLENGTASGSSDGDNHSTSSATALLGRPNASRNRTSSSKAHTDVIPRPIIKMPSNKSKGKQKVHYAEPTRNPVAPEEVLERCEQAVEETSAGAMATAAANADSDAEWGDVVMRDRMLVRVSYTESESLGLQFDEYQHRMTSGLRHEDWAEFMVVWRRDFIEVYEDYTIPGKERLTGHKHLAFLVPLKSGRTRLSLYSFVDLTFCITCPPTPTYNAFFHIARSGTNIFVFKPKNRSRGQDWMWQLWRHIGGQVPSMIEVRNPTLDAKVKIDVPMIATVEGYSRMFTRSNVIALCLKSLREVPDWKELIEQELGLGKVLELAWRMDTNLDWVWLEDDVYGQQRGWVVLCGVAYKQAHLELRLGDHYPARIAKPLNHSSTGTEDPFYREPPSIEGYLSRIKPNTQLKQRVYMTTHDGNLFTLPTSKAHPPSPFPLRETENYAQKLNRREVERGTSQILDAIAVADLRSIIAVRRAFQIVPPHTHVEVDPSGATDRHGDTDASWMNVWSQPSAEEGSHSDDEDEGGEDAVSKASDKPHLRMKRSFELFLKNGHVIRFECYSRRFALEWINRLRSLISYWKLRHRADAKDEMDVSVARRPRLTPRLHICDEVEDIPPTAPPDPAAPLPALTSLYNWCVLEGCKTIIRGGKIHLRWGLSGQFKLAQMILISGNLCLFRIKPHSALHNAKQKKIPLSDAYICSGYFAALALPQGQYDPDSNSVPRHYQDGLETDDPEEDTLFTIWYRPQSDADTVPSLSAKHKLVVFRTRNKLERDTWCWALNTEIERISRAQKDKEAKLRDTGQLTRLCL